MGPGNIIHGEPMADQVTKRRPDRRIGDRRSGGDLRTGERRETQRQILVSDWTPDRRAGIERRVVLERRAMAVRRIGANRSGGDRRNGG